MYVCSKCNHPLFSSRSKFAHSSPWPAFTDTIREDSVTKMMETLTAYKVTEAAISWMYHALYHHCVTAAPLFMIRNQYCITGICSVRPWLTWAMMGSFNVQWIFVHPGSVWKVWQRTGPRVCEWRSRGGSVTFLNIQPLAQVCPQQRWDGQWMRCSGQAAVSFSYHSPTDKKTQFNQIIKPLNTLPEIMVHLQLSQLFYFIYFFIFCYRKLFSTQSRK